MIMQFIVEQWVLVTILVVLVLMFLFSENKRAGKTVSPQGLSQLVNQQQALVVDIREHKDFSAGHITGSINIPYAKFEERKSELDKYRDKPVVLVCKMGQSVSGVAKQLDKDGFASVYRLSGGIMEWKNSQLPLVKA